MARRGRTSNSKILAKKVKTTKIATPAATAVSAKHSKKAVATKSVFKQPKKVSVNQAVFETKGARAGAAKAKKAAKVEKDLQHKPRKKTKADEIYNARRRAKRLRDRLLKDIEAGKASMESNRSFLEKLNATIEASYAGKKGAEAAATAVQAANILQQLAPAGLTRTLRLDKVFKFNLNTADKYIDVLGAGGEVAYRKLTKDSISTKAFYIATQDIWQGHPVSERNELIKKALGARTLQEAYHKVITDSKVSDQIKRAMVSEELKAIEAVNPNASKEEVINLLRSKLSSELDSRVLNELINNRLIDYEPKAERTTDVLDFDEPEETDGGSPIEFLMLTHLFSAKK